MGNNTDNNLELLFFLDDGRKLRSASVSLRLIFSLVGKACVIICQTQNPVSRVDPSLARVENHQPSAIRDLNYPSLKLSPN